MEGVRHDEARRRYERADLVVDQLNAGWYGIFALEAMGIPAIERAVQAAKAVQETQRELGVEVPIVPVTRETLRDRIADLATDAERRRAVGAASRAYVERIHDADNGADRLLELYASL